MTKALQDILRSCTDLIQSEQDIRDLIVNNPSGGKVITHTEVLENEDALADQFRFATLILLGPFWSTEGESAKTISDYCKMFAKIKAMIWNDFILCASNSEVQSVRDSIKQLRYELDEIPWATNSDTRLAHYLAIDSLYTLIFLYNHYPEYKKIALGLCLAEEPFSGYKKSRSNRSELSISAIEIKIILLLLKRGYSIPPVFFITDLLQQEEGVMTVEA